MTHNTTARTHEQTGRPPMLTATQLLAEITATGDSGYHEVMTDADLRAIATHVRLARVALAREVGQDPHGATQAVVTMRAGFIGDGTRAGDTNVYALTWEANGRTCSTWYANGFDAHRAFRDLVNIWSAHWTFTKDKD